MPEKDASWLRRRAKGAQEAHEYLYWTWREASGKPAGYTVCVGDWKAIVPSCADAANLKPSDADEMLLFDVVNDPFETQDRSSECPDRVAAFEKVVQSKDLTCECFQC